MIRHWLHDRRGSAAAEFALALPMMLALLFGGFEAGHFFWTEHKLVKAVRDGARFASRLPVDDLCNGPTDVMSSDTEALIQNVTATGKTVADAQAKAYAAVKAIDWPGGFYRSDIGWRAIEREKGEA